MKNIADNNNRRWCIYHLSIELIKGGSNIQHSMLALHKVSTTSWEKYCQVILPTIIITYLIIIYSFGPDIWIETIANIICQIFQYSIE